MNEELIIVCLVMGLFVLAAIVCAWRQFYEDQTELQELRYRVNIMDEVLTLHSEELDELNRDRLPMANRIADVEKRMMEPSFNAECGVRNAE